jgi:hypothetical protein
MSGAAAPVAFFAFNRPVHASRTLRALAANPEARDTTLHVFVDGPRHDGEREAVAAVREVVANAEGFAQVHVHAAEANRGLFASITGGVQRVLDAHDRVIVVEDDVETAPCFLAYMNDSLARYRDDARVGSIHAYAPPIDDLPAYFFLEGADCWGWATWADRWALFERDPQALLRDMRDRRLLRAFTASHGAQSLLQLVHRAEGRSQSWATQWHASLFLAGRHTLHPGRSFVTNIGNDGSGTHSGEHDLAGRATRTTYSASDLPSDVRQDPDAARSLAGFLDGLALRNVPLPLSIARSLLSTYARLRARRALHAKDAH